ncbi:uncharacterized protein LOC143471176 isoform X2 [Clavelina lepadiformis]|uniref:uncharacterized protein LOC143471176 isoform X2 n=1 Tax=Clavelina lepadiformis TaxID=159417 RepID=UPI0040417792
MAFNVTLPLLRYKSNEDFQDFLKVFNSYCASVRANQDFKKHLLIESFDKDFVWEIQGKDASVYDLEFDELVERASEAGRSKAEISRLKNSLLDRVQKPDESTRSFVYALRKQGDMAYASADQAPVKNEVLYLALIRGLRNRKISETLVADLEIGRDFFITSARAIALDVSEKTPCSDVFTVARLSHGDESRQDEATVLMKNELAKISGEIKLFNDNIQGRISSIDETVSSVKTQMNTLQRDVDRLHWKPRAPGPSEGRNQRYRNRKSPSDKTRGVLNNPRSNANPSKYDSFRRDCLNRQSLATNHNPRTNACDVNRSKLSWNRSCPPAPATATPAQQHYRKRFRPASPMPDLLQGQNSRSRIVVNTPARWKSDLTTKRGLYRRRPDRPRFH